jgi:hypothetical protein
MNYGAFNTGSLNGTSSTDENATLFGGIISSCTFKADGIFDDIFISGIVATCIINSKYVISCVGNGGISQTEILSAALSQCLVGGVVSTWTLTDIDVSSYFGDMLHNTWQLVITSATLTLEINTPIGDS